LTPLAEDQAGVSKTGINVAIAKNEAAGRSVESGASAARDSVEGANTALLESVR